MAERIDGLSSRHDWIQSSLKCSEVRGSVPFYFKITAEMLLPLNIIMRFPAHNYCGKCAVEGDQICDKAAQQSPESLAVSPYLPIFFRKLSRPVYKHNTLIKP